MDSAQLGNVPQRPGPPAHGVSSVTTCLCGTQILTVSFSLPPRIKAQAADSASSGSLRATRHPPALLLYIAPAMLASLQGSKPDTRCDECPSLYRFPAAKLAQWWINLKQKLPFTSEEEKNKGKRWSVVWYLLFATRFCCRRWTCFVMLMSLWFETYESVLNQQKPSPASVQRYYLHLLLTTNVCIHWHKCFPHPLSDKWSCCRRSCLLLAAI